MSNETKDFDRTFNSKHSPPRQFIRAMSGHIFAQLLKYYIVIGATLFSFEYTIDTIFIMHQLQQFMLAFVKYVVPLDLLVGPSKIGKSNAHLPKYMVSERMKEPIIATRIVLRGVKAVTKTGPLSFITST